MKTRFFTLWVFLLLSAYPLRAQEIGTANLKVTSVCETDSIRFHVINIGTADLNKSVEYFVIEDEIIARGYIDSLSQGDSLEFIVHPKGLSVSFEIEQIGMDKKKMIGRKEANCATVYDSKSWDIKGKFNQKVTGKLNDPWAVGVYVGSLGPGLSISKHINNKLTLRIGGTYAPVGLSEYVTLDGAETDVTLKLGTADFKMDYFFSKNPKNKFHFIVGGVYNFSEFKLDAVPQEENITFGNMVIDREDLGTISLKITPNKFNPFLGIGFGRLANYDKKIGFKAELGGLFIGSPNVDFQATGLVEPTAEQESIIERNLRQYYIYPSINLFMSVKL